MHHIAYIGLIDPHAERLGSHHNRPLVKNKLVLVLFPFLCGQARMISGHRNIRIRSAVYTASTFFLVAQ